MAEDQERSEELLRRKARRKAVDELLDGWEDALLAQKAATGHQPRWAGVVSVLRFTKDYWFLVTLVTSALLWATYMIVFQVTPWDTYQQTQARRQQVAVHSVIGHRLLERAHYQEAKAEFERGLALDPVHQSSQRGRYLAELFLAMELPTWDPAIWPAMRDQLDALGRDRGSEVAHVIEKLSGDVERRIGTTADAKAYYEKALTLKPDYPDALYSYGWMNYSLESPDTAEMKRLFRRMTELEQYDYRGFHGLGYALYIQAVNTGTPRDLSALIVDAAQQSYRASTLKIQQLNVTMDFGEIARSVLPETSIVFHELANGLLRDDETAKLPQNRARLGVQLLTSQKYVVIEGPAERQAWIDYQLALDHLALLRMGAGDTGQVDMAQRQAEHDRLFASAQKLDGRRRIFPIYVDQLAILDRLLPMIQTARTMAP